jgi:hypothetical protein
MIKRLLNWLFADLVADLFGVEDRILARMKQQEDEIFPEMFAKLEDYTVARVVDALVEQSLRVVGGRPNTRATAPLDEQQPEGSHDA